jgi:hypothetical protein
VHDADSARPITIVSHSSPLARRYCPARRPSSVKPAARYSAIAVALCANTTPAPARPTAKIHTAKIHTAKIHTAKIPTAKI